MQSKMSSGTPGTSNSSDNFDPTLFYNVYCGRLEKYVANNRKNYIISLVNNQVQAIKLQTTILHTIKITENIKCFMDRPSTSCLPQFIIPGGGLIYREKDGIPNSVISSSGTLIFTGGVSYSKGAEKILHNKLVKLFNLKVIHKATDKYKNKYIWYNVTNSLFCGDHLNSNLCWEDITYIKYPKRIISREEQKTVEAGTLCRVGHLINPFVYNYNKII